MYLKLIKKFIKDNYGESELSNPSYNLKLLAEFLERNISLNKAIFDYIDRRIELEIERNPELYNVRKVEYPSCSSGYETVADEDKALDNVLDDIDDILENNSVCNAFISYVRGLYNE